MKKGSMKVGCFGNMEMKNEKNRNCCLEILVGKSENREKGECYEC